MEFEDNALKCPRCGDIYIHHARIDIHARPREDGETVTVSIAIQDPFVLGAPPATENPSSRRNGVTICLYCESCRQFSELRIAQHKGLTIVDTK